jgi:hypothetical protein
MLDSSLMFCHIEPLSAVFGWNASGSNFFGSCILVRIAFVCVSEGYPNPFHVPVGAILVTTKLQRDMCTPQGKDIRYP